MLLDWKRVRRRSVPRFLVALSNRHPELRNQVCWDDFVRIAQREGVQVRLVPLSRPARLLRLGQHVCIQINKAITDRLLRTRYGMHELCHYWRDDPGEPCYHADNEVVDSETEHFADVFAWLTTSPARGHIRGLNFEEE